MGNGLRVRGASAAHFLGALSKGMLCGTNVLIVKRTVPAKLRGASGNRSSKYAGLETQSAPMDGSMSIVHMRTCRTLGGQVQLRGILQKERKVKGLIVTQAQGRPCIWIHLQNA